MSNPLLFLTVFPLAVGAVIFLMPDRMKPFARISSVIVSAVVLVAASIVFIKKPLAWQYAGSVMLAADNLSGFVGLGVAVFGFLVSVYSCGYTEHSIGRYFGYLLMTLGASLGVAYANNLVLLIIAWGFLAAMLYLMVNLKGDAPAASAAKKALIIIGGTDALMIFGIGLIWMMTGTLSIERINLTLSGPAQYIAYLLLAFAAFAKAGAMPFHAWLPDVSESAPTTVAAYLPASLDKLLGIYLLARTSLDLFVMTPATNILLMTVGSVTIMIAVMMALVQHNLKRLLGYHAVSQVGYMVLGIGTGTAIGIAGGLFHMLNNAIYKACLFMTGGVVEKRTGTVDLSRLGGLWRSMPLTFAACFIAALSISGIPPFNGFVSKWMIYQGIIETATVSNPLWVAWIVAAMFGSALTVASFMKLLHAVFLGRASGDWKGVKDAGMAMGIPMVILALACIIFGIFAVAIPLGLFILPAISGTVRYIGVWSPGAATALILTGIGLGSLVYAFFRPGRFRTTEIFIGGEDPGTLGRVSGAEFYNTISDIAPVARVFAKEESGGFDIYSISKRPVYFFTGILGKLHNGILPTYLVWCLLGMIAMFALLLFK